MIHVVAKDEAEFEEWFSTSNRPSAYGYIHGPNQIRELDHIEGLFIGTCFDRPDIIQILNAINYIRELNGKKKIPPNDIRHLTRYKLTDHSFLNTTTNWSQNNVPVTASQGYTSALMGKTSLTAVFDELHTSFKVPLSKDKVDQFSLQAARLYSSYITNTFNPLDDAIEYYFNDKNHAQDFAAKYNSVAYEYK